MTGTKDRIFRAALLLFARHSYQAVSIRDIAEQSEIKASSIYNHYVSKEAILQAVYDYFDVQMRRTAPRLEELLGLAEKEHPHDLLCRISGPFPAETAPMTAQSMIVTSSLVHVDEQAESLIFQHLIRPPREFDPPLLEKMLRENRIHPVDVDAFALIHSGFCHSAVLRMCSTHSLSEEEWSSAHELLCSLVRVVEPTSAHSRKSVRAASPVV